MNCQPIILTGSGDIKFDTEGQLLEPVSNPQLSSISSVSDADNSFASNATGSIQKMNEIMSGMGVGASWHNDSFASDGINYFIMQATNSSRLLDPDLPVPTFEDAVRPLQEVYSKLFAI
ncbi:hypothetical protein BDV96DRAFT_647803 [Lophiotrema nucula]|uniref:Uncharacterized protein n=1 Tax=Lophiotrema nucula TaxID=690887 RepID=A0A6A5Z3G9_9PLEO|nr:hypothetical protein BDV96DRAFT_647803 [Lophiotrema nucula]